VQFVPLWTSVLRSRKVASLSESLRWTWIACLLVAQEHDHKHGTLPNVDDMSYALHMEPAELMSRLSRLSRAGFIEEHGGVYSIHDWDDWKHRPDPTATARKRAQRERERLKTQAVTSRNGEPDASGDVTVTAVTSKSHGCHAPTQLNRPQQNTHPPTPRDGGDECACEPFDPSGEEDESPDIVRLPEPAWTTEQRRVVEQATRWWGASNGDSVVGSLLRTYPVGWVEEAIHSHHGKVQDRLQPARLEGFCRMLWAGGAWQPEKRTGPGKPLRHDGPTNMPPAIPPEELARLQAQAGPQMTREEYRRQLAEQRRAHG